MNTPTRRARHPQAVMASLFDQSDRFAGRVEAVRGDLAAPALAFATRIDGAARAVPRPSPANGSA